MRQQTKPFIIERKPSHKPKSVAAKPSIWGQLDADVAKGLHDQQGRDRHDTDRAAITGGVNRV